MPKNEKHWKTVARSQFPWEQEALDFIYDNFPAQDNYRAWANFEFIGDDGSINEVDLLVACPQGVFLIEIKSNPGDLSGNVQEWVWDHDGRRKTIENPVILANRKCKRLKSLLGRQKAFRKEKIPFVEPLVFLSNSNVVCHLSANSANYVRLRDTDSRSGIMGAIKRRECSGFRQFDHQLVNRPQLKALGNSMDQAGILPVNASRRVGDFELGDLIFDSPLGIYQDWHARHVSLESTKRVARIYMVARQTTAEDREVISKAAQKEYRLLECLDHPGIIKADIPTECEYGPVLFLRNPQEGIRLDHFLAEQGDSLPVAERIDILRQIGETIAYVHGKRIIHRSLSPQSILVHRNESGRPVVQIFNWQTGAEIGSEESTTSLTQISKTLHAGQLLEDSSHVYIAPEALTGRADGGPEMDVFSLGALTYYLFTEKPPADTIAGLQQKLSSTMSSGLNISEAMDGAVDALVETVRDTAKGTASDRNSIEDFLVGLDLIEYELSQPDETIVINPLEARIGDHLPGGYLIENRLGSGSVSVVFLVSKDGRTQVLKVAREPKYNERIKDEFEVLSEIKEKVRSRIVVAPFDLLEFGDLLGFTMESAGEKTMARHLREVGALDLIYLQRFGEDLIQTIRDLDSAGGIAHRDIKPENLGLRMVQNKQYQLCVFDFSLAKASPEDIRVGTLSYLDPFISERKVKRWDISSECFSAAMTLHEMTTGVLPTWGDGKSDAASVKGEVNIQPERFDPDLRDRFAQFYSKALARDFKERFDNPGEMLQAWKEIFATVDDRKSTSTQPVDDGEKIVFDLPELLTPGTQLVLIGLSTRLLNALDRLSLVTVADLLSYPLLRIYKLPNVGNKTRRELGALVKALREKLTDFEADPAKAIEAINDEESPDNFESVDLIAKQVAIIGRGTDRQAEQDILQAFLGWEQPGEQQDGPLWTSQSELAPLIDVTRQRVGQVVTEARERWKRFPSITALRENIAEILYSQGGVVVLEELISAILAARGSSFEEPKRSRMAAVVTRAAVETERSLKESRYMEYRSGDRIFISLSPDLKNYAIALGAVADRLAGEDPIPSPSSALEAVRRVKAPEFPPAASAPSDQRLCQLAVAASSTADLSSRMEIYPIGLQAGRALILTQNALFGGTLTIDEIQSRVSARLPRAEPLPGRPELDQLMDQLGLDFQWNASAAKGRGAYEMPGGDGLSLHSSDSLSSRQNTRSGPAPVGASVEPEIAEARAIEDKLQYAANKGAYLAISFPPGLEREARRELVKRFPESVTVCDLDQVFVDTMRRAAEQAGAEWDVVLQADAAPPKSTERENLQILVDRCMADITKEMTSADTTKLLLHPGLLARYDRIDVLSQLASEVGRSDGVYGLWVLVPASGQSDMPTLNQRAIPLSNPAQHVQLNKAWINNKHR